MRIYLDARDLIPLVDQPNSETSRSLASALRSGDRSLLLSPMAVLEASARLRHKVRDPSILPGLSTLEQLPHEFIAEVLAVPKLELEGALLSLRSGDRPNPINPYFSTFGEALGEPLLSDRSLTEAVDFIWKNDPNGFSLEAEADRILSRIRYLKEPPPLSNRRLEIVLREHLLGLGMQPLQREISHLRNLLEENPETCPGFLLNYHIFDLLRRDAKRRLCPNDLKDIWHATCVPYADVATLDRDMRALFESACKRAGFDFQDRVHRDLASLLRVLPG